MPLKCGNCSEEAFDEEEHVCKACGTVNEDIQIWNEYNPASSFKPFQDANQRKHQPNALNYGSDVLKSLCHEYNVAPDIRMETSSLLNCVYSSHTKAGRAFRFRGDVGILAGCCLLSVQKQHKQFMSFPNLCSKLKCSKKRAFKFQKLVKLYLEQRSNHTEDCEDNSLNETEEIKVEDHTLDNDFMDPLISSITDLLSSTPEESKEELTQKTISLTKLAYSCWLLTGRSTEGTVTAAAFLCWKSMHPSRKSLSLQRFCKEFSLNTVKARLRVPELRDMLVKLGRNIPSVTKNYVHEKNYLFHLNYILENSDSLRNDLLTDEFTEDAIKQKEFDTFRGAYIKQRPHIDTVSLYDADMDASEIEISDTEISSYIRTSEQVTFIKSLKESRQSQ